jgi:hypothetical protein
MALKTLSAIALLLATTTANALTIDPQAPCASPAPDPYGALLNVRSGPGSQFPIVNQLRPGDIVAMLPELSGNWQHIAVYEGDGWAFRPYLQVVACPPPPPALDAPASPVAPPEGIQSAPLEDIPPLALPFAPSEPVLPPAYAYAPPPPSGPVLLPADWYRPWASPLSAALRAAAVLSAARRLSSALWFWCVRPCVGARPAADAVRWSPRVASLNMRLATLATTAFAAWQRRTLVPTTAQALQRPKTSRPSLSSSA